MFCVTKSQISNLKSQISNLKSQISNLKSLLLKPNQMKKVFIMAVLISGATAAPAQVTGGLKGGLNLAKQKWEFSVMGQSASEKFDGTGFNLGGYLNYGLSDVVSLQPELLYTNHKVEQDGDELTFNYISVPIMLGYAVEN